MLKSHAVVVTALSLTFALSACDKKASIELAQDPVAATDKGPVTAPQDLKSSPLGEMVFPENNKQSDAKVKLGHQLFFDARLSSDGSRSCYSCHTNEDGNGGKDPIAIGPGDKKLTRHSPVIWNVGYLGAFYWDGRSDSLEAQATAAWAGGNMAVGKDNLVAKAKEIEAIAGYKKQFDAVFPGEGVTPETIVKAISAYERTLICDDTAYDRHVKGDASALTDVEKRGLELFNGAAGCVACHTPPFFSSSYATKTGTYYNAGIGTAGKKPEEVDVGRMSVTKLETDWAAFKVPSLRNVSLSAPYFHDGSEATLDAAVRVMASGGVANKNLSAILSDKKLGDAQIADLVAFLGALDCKKSLEKPTLP
jgi:cytochrome c peroxidase